MRLLFKAESASPEAFSGLVGLGRFSREESEEVAELARRGIDILFKLEQDPHGVPWAPLAPRTVRDRTIRKTYGHITGLMLRGSGPEHPILQRSGGLRFSFTLPTHPQHVTRVRKLTASTVVSVGARDTPGSKGRIALLHKGGKNPQQLDVPARAFIGLNRVGKGIVARGVEEILDKKVEKVGGKK